jgi:hypothetical protein
LTQKWFWSSSGFELLEQQVILTYTQELDKHRFDHNEFVHHGFDRHFQFDFDKNIQIIRDQTLHEAKDSKSREISKFPTKTEDSK